eukprot:m.350427 g.350427  ORF g.350427 m.350427 type:complete len:151 (+) comp27970_c0_seq1:43-495(+)
MATKKKKVDLFAVEASEAFAYHDRDHDGKIAAEGIATLMNSMGQYPTQAECQQLLKEAGVKGPTFSLPHFMAALKSHQSKTTNFEAEILEAFKAFDHSGSGMISSEELLRCLTRLGQKMHPQTAAAFVKAANRQGQDMVNYRELARLLTR